MKGLDRTKAVAVAASGLLIAFSSLPCPYAFIPATTTPSLRRLSLSEPPTSSFNHLPHRRTGLSMQLNVVTIDDEVIRAPIQPVGNHIFIKLQEQKDFTAGGIALPNQSQDKPLEGKVVAAGTGRYHPYTAKLIPMCVEVGDTVVFSSFSGTTCNYMGDEHKIITDDDLLLVYNGDSMKVDNLKMVRDQVLVKIERDMRMTDKGIALAASAVEKDLKSEGVVVAVGEGRTGSEGTLVPTPMKVGEYVKFRPYAGIDISIEGAKYSVCRMIDCLSKWS